MWNNAQVRNGNGRAPTDDAPGVTASSSLVQTEGGQALPGGAYSGEDPAWLALPAVYYAQLPGGQQPSFRMAAGRPDARIWLAWEVRLAGEQLLPYPVSTCVNHNNCCVPPVALCCSI